MSTFCACSGSGNGNTGLPTKRDIEKNTVALFAWDIYASDGTRNEIDEGDTLDEAYFDALINHEDPTKRIRPIGLFKNVDRPTPDNITESFADGSSAIIQSNPYTFLGFLLNTPPLFINKLSRIACYESGFLLIDACGAPVGALSKDGTKLRPIEINGSSFDAKYVPPTDTAVAKIQVAFEFSRKVDISSLRMIAPASMGASVDLISASGLIDVDAVITVPTTTGFIATLTTDAGGFLSNEPVKGFVLADFDLYNDTTEASITPTSVTDNGDGSYTFVIPAQTSLDSLTLSSASVGNEIVKTGFEITPAIIAIP